MSLTNHRDPIVRLFEILPGLAMWAMFVVPVILAFFYSKVVMILVMLYALFWFFRTIQMSYHLILGYRHYRRAMKVAWATELKQAHPKTWDSVIHLVFIPMYKESYEIVAATLEALIASDYPSENIIPVVCTEQRAGLAAQSTAKLLTKNFANRFLKFYTTVHPVDIPGEVKGKGPNITYAAKQISPEVLKDHDAAQVLVTTLDADNRVDPRYFSCVTKAFLEANDPKHTSFQPLSLYFNNIWDVPLFIRMVALGASFWIMVQATRPGHLRNFSAHSQSMEGLLATDFWSVQTIVEDGHQFWRSWVAFHGNHEVVPIFVPIYQDAVLSKNIWSTIREQYRQKRRWAWGVSDVPYVFYHNLKDKSLPKIEKWKLFVRLFEGHFSWSTTSIVLAIVGWTPLLINQTFQYTVLGYNYPFYYSKILTIAWIGMIVSMTISTLILPPRKKPGQRWLYLIDWIVTPIMLPVTSILFGAIPAIDSQTRLMLGNYFEDFHVTEKRVVT